MLDGSPAGTYQHIPDPEDAQYLYNIVVFSEEGLSNELHTLVITAEQGSEDSLLLFDWVMYTCVRCVSKSIAKLKHIHLTKL